MLVGCHLETGKNSISKKSNKKTGITLPVKKKDSVQGENSKIKDYSISFKDIPSYNGKPYVFINGNKPYFKNSEYTLKAFKHFSDLDYLGRCQKAYACLSDRSLPTEKRQSIGMVKPTGWHTYRFKNVTQYESTSTFLSNLGYLYNRCHLIAYELSGENANKKNLITGTRYFNIGGMLPFENKTAKYLKNSSHHVLYRVTPIYKENELLARGVLMEAASVHDKGKSFHFCIFCYNVQPGISINYGDGSAKEN